MFKSSIHSNSKIIFCLLIPILVCCGLAFNTLPAPVKLIIGLQSAGCKFQANQRLLNLDGVNLTLCFPFSPSVFIGASENDMVQSAYAFSPMSKQELALYAIPYGLQPASDGLPEARAGITDIYQELSFKAFEGEILQDFPTPSINLFGKMVSGRSVVMANPGSRFGTSQQMLTQWVVEAGSRVWLVRLTSFADSFTTGSVSTTFDQSISMASTDLAQPSVSLQIANQSAVIATGDGLRTVDVLPTPAWWNGDCDVKNFAGSVPLGSSYRGVKTCGPLNTMHLVNFGVGTLQYEWQCVEYVKRYIYLAFGIAPYSANGNTVVSNYSGTRLTKVLNGTANKGPIPGDVISYTGPSTYGHTSLVIASNIDTNGNGSITIAEQNYSKLGTRTHTVSKWSIVSSDGVYGWLHDSLPVNNPPTGFTKCANEVGICSFSGIAEVVYGAVNSFTTPRVFTNDVPCNSAVFGNPIPGSVKACYAKLKVDAVTMDWTTAYFNGNTHWLDSSNLTGQMCTETLNSFMLDKNYGAASPCPDGAVDDWVADYSAIVNFAPGMYIFQAQNDDGVQVWVDGQKIINRSASASLVAACPARSLSGNVPVRVLFREVSENARIRLVWTTATGICNPPGVFGKTAPALGATSQTVAPTISWRASSGALSYDYCIDTSNDSICDSGWQNVGTLTSKALSGLAYSTTYYWQVRSTNVNGITQADGGSWWSFSTGSDPTTCYALTSSHTGSGSDPVSTPTNALGCNTGSYHAGDIVTLIANPDSGSRVNSWSGTSNDEFISNFNTISMPASAAAVAVNYLQAAPLAPLSISPVGIVLNDLHPIYKWNAASGANSYLITVFNEDLGSIQFENVVVPSSSCKGIPAICSYHPEFVLANYNYGFKVAATNETGSSEFSAWRSFYIAKRVTSLTSIAAEDGYIRESGENSNMGGAVNSSGTSFLIGDNLQNAQFRSFLSFDTSALPDNAVILSVVLRLTLQGTVGMDPFSTHGLLAVDVRKPNFGTSSALRLDDFNATPGIRKAGVIKSVPVNSKYVANLLVGSFSEINKTGLTQMRLYFQTDDDNDLTADYLMFISSNSANTAGRPILEISYYLP